MSSSSSTQYQARFTGPELIERSSDPVRLRVRAYEGADVIQAISGTISVYDRSGTAVVDGAGVSVDDARLTAYYDLPSTSDRALEDGWSIVWRVVMPDGEAHTYQTDGALVLWRGSCPVTHQDIVDRLEQLDATSRAPITRRTTWDPKIRDAWSVFQDDLTQRGRRPWLILSVSACHRPVLYKALELVLEDLGMRGNATALELARRYGERYADSMSRLTLRYDTDSDGAVDDADERTAARPGLIWGTGGGTSFGGPRRRR